MIPNARQKNLQPDKFFLALKALCLISALAGWLSAAGCTRLPAALPTADLEQPETGAFGLVLGTDGTAAAGAWVYAYRNDRGNFRGPAEYAARVEEDGSYVLDLLPGQWYLVARYRIEAEQTGPPRPGDAWAIYSGNPVLLARDTRQRIDFRLLAVSQPMLLRGGGLSRGDTGFRGRLVDDSGRPIAGALALAYRDRDFRRMPDQASAPVGADGRFVLYVPETGRYCLAARERNRGQPVQGELYGLLGEGNAGCPEAVEGTILDVGDIHLVPYMR